MNGAMKSLVVNCWIWLKNEVLNMIIDLALGFGILIVWLYSIDTRQQMFKSSDLETYKIVKK